MKTQCFFPFTHSILTNSINTFTDVSMKTKLNTVYVSLPNYMRFQYIYKYCTDENRSNNIYFVDRHIIFPTYLQVSTIFLSDEVRSGKIYFVDKHVIPFLLTNSARSYSKHSFQQSKFRPHQLMRILLVFVKKPTYFHTIFPEA